MTQHTLITRTIAFVKTQLANAEGGHDWFHIERVWKLSKRIAESESVDLLVVELAALLHDIADPKFHDGDEEIGPRMAREFLLSQGAGEEVIAHVENIIRHMSFKNSLGDQHFRSPEMDVVQDADRLDAIGAIGIARTFNYGGFKKQSDLQSRHFTQTQYDKRGIQKEQRHDHQSFLRKTPFAQRHDEHRNRQADGGTPAWSDGDISGGILC